MNKFWFVMACIEWVAAGIAAFVLMIKGIWGLFFAVLIGGAVSGALFYTLSLILDALDDTRWRLSRSVDNEKIITDNQFELKKDIDFIKNKISNLLAEK